MLDEAQRHNKSPSENSYKGQRNDFKVNTAESYRNIFPYWISKLKIAPQNIHNVTSHQAEQFSGMNNRKNNQSDRNISNTMDPRAKFLYKNKTYSTT